MLLEKLPTYPINEVQAGAYGSQDPKGVRGTLRASDANPFSRRFTKLAQRWSVGEIPCKSQPVGSICWPI